MVISVFYSAAISSPSPLSSGRHRHLNLNNGIAEVLLPGIVARDEPATISSGYLPVWPRKTTCHGSKIIWSNFRVDFAISSLAQRQSSNRCQPSTLCSCHQKYTLSICPIKVLQTVTRNGLFLLNCVIYSKTKSTSYHLYHLSIEFLLPKTQIYSLHLPNILACDRIPIIIVCDIYCPAN